jgi:hypothetical protein
MKKIIAFLLIVASVSAITGCKKFLDVNQDPDTPQFPDPSSVFPTQLAGIPRGLQFDARYVSRWVQNFGTADAARTADINWDRMGFASSSDANGDIWRQAYFGLGQNLVYIIREGIKNKQYDYVGAAYALQALMFQYTTDYHGEIIFTEAFRDNQAFFKFDDQELVYKGVDSICLLALEYLARTDGSTSATKLAKGDFVYSGDVAKWTKFVWGIRARNWHHLTNKAEYNADSVISFCNKSLANVNDDFVIPFDALKNDDANFFGTFRDNLTFMRQSGYIVRLMDGTLLAGSRGGANIDPRIKHMLSMSQDSTGTGNGGYRGVEPGVGDPNFSSGVVANQRRRVAAPWGDSIYTNPSRNNFSTNVRKYLFGDKVVMPVMTASEIQFIKAEAAFRKNDKATALAAYTSGINLHFDFINRPSFPRANNLLFNQNPIPASERAAYLASNNVKKTEATLTLADIMLQKFIALWGWGFFETWVDLRRYHYLDIDPSTGQQVYLGFVPPATLAAENIGKLVYRVRPRFNSEYVWNIEELRRIGALNSDYHTYETWMSKP